MLYDRKRLAGAGMDPDLVEKLDQAYETLRLLIEQDVPLSVSYSGGKDSSVVLILTLLAYQDVVERRRATDPGRYILPLHVVTASTGIENPVIEAYLQGQLAQLAGYALRKELDVRIRVARPSLASTWQVGVIGGRRLPTFLQSATRDCTIDFKIRPMQRLLREIKGELVGEVRACGGKLEDLADQLARNGFVAVIGTRFEESAMRARRMAARGDAAGEITVLENGDRTLPIIASFTTDDVWEVLAYAGQGEEHPLPAFAQDFDETRDVYRDATGECPVVASMKQRSAACGARFGCALCVTSGGSDKSMQTMIAQPKYAYLDPLNQIRNHLVATRTDLSRRRWVGRTHDRETSMVRIHPDVYSPAMCEELLGLLLTADVREQERADSLGDAWRRHLNGERVNWPDPYLQERAGKPDREYVAKMSTPQFRFVTPEILVMIDVLWARYGGHKPFRALWLWREVWQRGRRFEVPAATWAPEGDASQGGGSGIVMPAPRWAAVEIPERVYHPLFDPVGHALMERPGVDLGQVDRKTTVPMRHDDVYEVDAESALLVMEFELDKLLSQYHDGSFGPEAALQFYLRYGVLSVPKGQVDALGQITEHTRALERAGLSPDMSQEQVLAPSISDAEYRERKPRMVADEAQAVA